MTTKHTLYLVPCLVVALLVPAVAQQANNEEFARRQYESGLSFLQNKRYADAVKDLQSVADSFPESTIADNALLTVAEYQIDTAHDLDATQKAVDRILKDFANSDSAAMAHVISGRLAIAKGRAQADVDSAMASFERVSRLFPGTEGVAAAGFYAGETLRLTKRPEEALDRYRRVRVEFPRSIWAGRAAMGAGYCLLQQGNATAALGEIQWARQQFPGTAVASDALNLNTIIYRLYVRAPQQPPFSFSGRGIGEVRANYSDILGLRLENDGRLFLGHKNGVAVFDDKGAAAGSVAIQEPTAFYLDSSGRVVYARANNLIIDKGESQSLSAFDDEKRVRFLEEIPAVLLRPKGERLVSDIKQSEVLRYGADGKLIGSFAKVGATKMTANSMEDVAMLDKDSKSIFFSDRDGKALGKLANKGPGYEFGDPIDIAYDWFDQLYVLDRGKATVWVFAPKGNKLVGTITLPEKSPGAFTRAAAFSVDRAGRLFIYALRDRAGRLFIFDERAKRIQVYQ
jgi:TolA-binding protein